MAMGRDNGDKSGFHGVEVLRKVDSMLWKTGEYDFHGVEDFGGRGRATPPPEERREGVGVLAWNVLEERVDST